MAETFRRKNRILKTRHFRRASRTGASFRREFLTMKVAPNGLDTTRVGLIIDSRRIRLALRRNRLKRILRESFRKYHSRMKQGFDLVLIMRNDPGEEACYRVVSRDFLGLTKDAGILI